MLSVENETGAPLNAFGTKLKSIIFELILELTIELLLLGCLNWLFQEPYKLIFVQIEGIRN